VRLARGDRAWLAALRVVSGAAERVSRGRSALARFARRAQPLVDKQRWVQIPPRATFGEERCVREGAPRKLFFVASHESPEIVVRPADPLAIARRMVFSLAEERSELLSLYRKFRFAFPQARNPLLDECEARERALLERALASLEAYEVLHPYPVSIPALYRAMAPHCG
jgi:hypothetical protein